LLQEKATRIVSSFFMRLTHKDFFLSL